MKNKLKETYEKRSELLKKFGYKSYEEYLQSDEWRDLRERIKKRKTRKWNFCNICGTDKYLDLHHSSYKVIGQKHPHNTVKLLCRSCHYELHKYSKENPHRDFYSCFSRIRNERKGKGLPIFLFVKEL